MDNSLTPEKPKIPDFKVSTEYYQVENGYERMGLGDQEKLLLENCSGTR